MNELLRWTEAGFDWTWRTSLAATLLFALVWAARRALGNWPTARWSYALSALILIRLLTPMVPSSPVSLENLLPAWARLDGHAKIAKVRTPISRRAATGAGAYPAVSGTENAHGWRAVSIHEALSVAWAMGLCAALTLSVARHCRWSRRIENGHRIEDPRLTALLQEAQSEMGVSRPVEMIALSNIPSPAVFGCRRVRLLLPEEALARLEADEWRWVFLHEMAHVRRRDVLVNYVWIGLRALHWFNPIIGRAQRQFSADRELVCDAMALGKAPADCHVRYGKTLLKMMDAFSTGAGLFNEAVPVIGCKHDIQRRILMIKQHGKSTLAARAAGALTAAVIAGAALTGAQAKPSSSENTVAPTAPQAPAATSTSLTPPSTPVPPAPPIPPTTAAAQTTPPAAPIPPVSPSSANNQIAVPAEPGPWLAVVEKAFDFGTAKAGDIVKHIYTVVNQGTETLEISKVVPACGCTTAGDFSHRIEPGQTGTIAIQLNTAHKSGPITKTVAVYSNSKSGPKETLLIRGTVITVMSAAGSPGAH